MNTEETWSIVITALSVGLLTYLLIVWVSDWRATRKFWKAQSERQKRMEP